METTADFLRLIAGCCNLRSCLPARNQLRQTQQEETTPCLHTLTQRLSHPYRQELYSVHQQELHRHHFFTWAH